MITKLVSGGQTGADIAALDVALRHGFPHGGWCPKGRKSLEGAIPAHYQLTETPYRKHIRVDVPNSTILTLVAQGKFEIEKTSIS